MPEPLRLDRLPWVAATGLAAALRASARLGGTELDSPLSLTLPPFGLVSVRCVDITVAALPDETDVIWTLARGGQQGQLILDGLGALRVVAAILGLPAPLALRALGAAERGVVTAAIASILHALATGVVVSLGAGKLRGDDLSRVILTVESKMFQEQVALDIPPEWIPARGEISLPARASSQGLQIPVSVELARTILIAHDWSRARPGDAIVFDERSAVGGNDDWAVQIVCGEFAADALSAPSGLTRLVTGFQPTNRSRSVVPTRHNPMPSGRETSMSSDDKGTSSLTVLASAPIEIVAEIGRIVLRADEVTALRPGSVLTLGPLRPTTVDLMVGERTWARGELVDVEGQLGVRLTSLAANGGPHRLSGEAETQR